MFGGRWELKKDEDNCYFIDRDPTYFKCNYSCSLPSNYSVDILNFLRGEHNPNLFRNWKEEKVEQLQQDIDFYQIQGMKIQPDISKIAIKWSSTAHGPYVRLTNNNCTATATSLGGGYVIVSVASKINDMNYVGTL
jgi:hypothetical protein